MATQPKQPNSPQPLLPELLRKYLQERVIAHGDGFASVESQGEVVPYSATAAQPIDAKLAWDEARAVLSYLVPSGDSASWKAPTDWASLVSSQTGGSAIPFCLGNYPQLVQDFGSFIQQGSLTASQPIVPFSISPKLEAWLARAAWQENVPNPLLAAAVLRLAGHLDRASDLLQDHKHTMPKEYHPAWANESSALAWHRGQWDQAAQLWKDQVDSTPIFFNRGIAALMLGQADEAHNSLSQAIESLPDSDAWHHLAGLYLALAEFKR